MATADQDVLAAIGLINDRLQGHLNSWAQSGTYRTPLAIYQLAEDLFLLLAALESWPRGTWRTLEKVCECADAIRKDGQGNANDWRRARISADVLGKLENLVEKIPGIVDPLPPKPPRHIPLETIEQLDAQKVSDRQIATIYGWKTADGQCDLDKVARCRKGELKAPTEVIRPPDDGEPNRPPHAGLLHNAADVILGWRDMKPADVLELVRAYNTGDEVDEGEEAPEEQDPS